MKMLSYWQPWASLIADGIKLIETRSWYTDYRGILGIHASLIVDKDACIQFGYDPRTIVRGAILGYATLIDCVQFPNERAPPDPYGDFTSGRYGWLLSDVTKYPNPIQAKGHQGFWNWNDDNPSLTQHNLNISNQQRTSRL